MVVVAVKVSVIWVMVAVEVMVLAAMVLVEEVRVVVVYVGVVAATLAAFGEVVEMEGLLEDD